MRPRTDHVLLLLLTLPTALAAQGGGRGRDVDVLVGRWYNGNRAATYDLRTGTGIGGVFSHGFVLQVIIHDSLGRNRAFYGAGWELHALRHRAVFGPYLIAGATIGLSTDTAEQAVATMWNVGAGVEWRPASWFGLTVEARYRIEDRGPRGFWRTAFDSRDGVSAGVGVSLGFRGAGRRSTASPRPVYHPPPQPPLSVTGSAATVVQTALAALGTPYQWGGTAENGFDCSGLIQYAYGQHGIRLPRMSRDQARSGTEVPPVVGALQAGDILLFAAQSRGGVSHVGMYVGEEKFIHSSSTGVRLSRLAAADPDGAWWVARWVGARRIMP